MEKKIRKLILKGRYYRNIPIDKPGYEEENLILDAEKTSLVVMHCWNIGDKENPLDLNFCVGMGFPKTIKESHKIIKKYIKPAVEISRKAKILVSHVESPVIGKKHIQVQKELKKENSKNSGLPPVVPEYKEKILYRAFGKGYNKNSPYTRMDRVKMLLPKKGEPFVYQTEEFDKILRKKGIENLIYTGFATDMCILYSPGGILSMFNLGYRVFLIREATLGVEYPDTFNERLSTKWALRFFESHYGDTIGFDDFMFACRNLLKKSNK